MKNKLLILAMIAATSFIWFPAANGDTYGQTRYSTRSHRYDDHGRGRRNRGHRKYTYGYKNYGQYRRTQVGNRRYRLAKRYYWRDGVRLSRMIRIYY
jgi:hypothetical protein